ncbi:MAG TPA: hypothetical protein VI544_01840 [Candidatus Nanoarchaeia archaeon]|nr:hypothetical protein [Candidatus Nanoarchaeia archaeon]
MKKTEILKYFSKANVIMGEEIKQTEETSEEEKAEEEKTEETSEEEKAEEKQE